VDHGGCAARFAWIMAAAPESSRGSWRLRRAVRVDHGGCAGKLTWIMCVAAM
jgi:hypothetical protein